jgi:hypothetical protein
MTLAQQTMPLFDWDWVGRNLDTIWDKTVEHLSLTGIALLVAEDLRPDYVGLRDSLHHPVVGSLRPGGSVHRHR